MLKLKVLSTFTEQLSKSFDNLIDDTYLKSTFKFRKRAYSTGKIINNLFSWNETNTDFLQATAINNYLGGIPREYIPIDPDVREDVLQQVVINAYHQLPLGDYDVGVHLMRIVANTNNQGIPTPEGIHQDGFDYVTITCVNLSNVSGAITVLFDTQDHTKIAFEGTLQPGMQLVFSDRTLSHFTSNVNPKIPGDACRDVIVTTFLTRHK